MLKKSNLVDLCEYEIMSSWWTGFVSWGWLQNIVGKYFAWKTQRKFAAYQFRIGVREKLTGKPISETIIEERQHEQ